MVKTLDGKFWESFMDGPQIIVEPTPAEIKLNKWISLIGMEDTSNLGNPFVAWQLCRQEGAQYLWIFDHREAVVEAVSQNRRFCQGVFCGPAVVRVARKKNFVYLNFWDLSFIDGVSNDSSMNVLMAGSTVPDIGQYDVRWKHALLGPYRSKLSKVIVTLAQQKPTMNF